MNQQAWASIKKANLILPEIIIKKTTKNIVIILY